MKLIYYLKIFSGGIRKLLAMVLHQLKNHCLKLFKKLLMIEYQMQNLKQLRKIIHTVLQKRKKHCIIGISIFSHFFFFDIFNYFCSKNIAKLFNFIVIFAGKYLNLIIQVEVNRLLPIFGCHDG